MCGENRRTPAQTRCRRAHPRVCGENLAGVDWDMAPPGSSPRVRGKHPRRERAARARGLIPACAGKTFRSPTLSPVARAHPRACGENVVAPDALRGLCGSSPRVRGKRRDHGPLRRATRLIPARAGKTCSGRPTASKGWAHPRACGENATSRAFLMADSGSSPRVRGKRVPGGPHCLDHGLIPARAGKTMPNGKTACKLRAHPRACGENDFIARMFWSIVGSSPRVRGKRARPRRDRRSPGLIPARAGKTSHVTAPRDERRAHPRACGENAITMFAAPTYLGSSPRVRGKRRSISFLMAKVRLIPARAGKTQLVHDYDRAWQAHPRACGENHPNRHQGRDSRGSSPRVRGKRN